MKRWTPQHEQLLRALRAEQLVPRLVQRLSMGRYVADEALLRQLSDWPTALKRSPGWRALMPVLDDPNAWPAVWGVATQLGFTYEADHHHALLFETLCARLTRDADYEGARWCWDQALSAWQRLLQSDYMAGLVSDLCDGDAQAAARHAPIIAQLLDAPIARMASLARDALGVDARASDEALDRRRARFAWGALERAQRGLEGVSDPHGALRSASAAARIARAEIVTAALSRFGAMVEALTVSEADAATLQAPFAWISALCEIIGIGPDAAVAVPERAVAIGWTLHKLDLEASRKREFDGVLKLADPFNRALRQGLRDGSLLGHNIRCADFLMFQGEQEPHGAARRRCFEEALEVNPGHRNSAMLLSYELLAEATLAITQAQLTPKLMRGMGVSTNAYEAIHKAHALIERAGELYPPNKNLEKQRAQLQSEADRLGIALRWRDDSAAGSSDSASSGGEDA